MIKPQSPAHNKPEAVFIHTATSQDAPAIAALARQLAQDEGSTSLCDEAAVLRLLKSKTEPVCHVKVARHNDKIVGFVVFYPGYDLSSDSYGFHIADICVDTNARRQGTGTRLIAAIAGQAEKESRVWLSLTVLRANKKAQKFYAARHFIQTGADLWATGKIGILSNLNRSLR